MTTIIGVDPGLSGAMAAIDPRGGARILDLPTKPMEWSGFGDRRIDCRALARALRELYAPAEPVVVVLEEVGIMGAKGNAIGTVGSLCGTACLILGALDILGITPITVRPQKWKATYGLRKEPGETDTQWKKRHCALALSLYPDAPITRAKDHNRAEALLIAHYGRGLQ